MPDANVVGTLHPLPGVRSSALRAPSFSFGVRSEVLHPAHGQAFLFLRSFLTIITFTRSRRSAADGLAVRHFGFSTTFSDDCSDLSSCCNALLSEFGTVYPVL